ncbi:MAG: glycosyltransferase [Armatimonadota bacterium]|nr:glycosyltransferase [Armatimonadota bacterium]
MDELKVYSQFSEIDLLTFHDENQPEVPALLREHLKPYCRTVESVPISLLFNRHRLRQAYTFLRAQLGMLPFRVMKFLTPQMQELIRQKLAQTNYDIIHFNYLSTTGYLPSTDGYHAVRLCTEANVEWEIFERYARVLPNPLKRLLAAREARRLRRYEVKVLNQMDGVIVLSERDRDLLQLNGVCKPIHIFRRPMEIAMPPLPRWEQSEPIVISLGRLDETRTHGTLWCLRKVWHKVRQQVPDARWHIIGADPPPSIRAFHGNDGIFVEGFVEDLTPFLQRARACIIPLFIGGGIRIKILDMLSVGLPCVSTSVGAQGLENEGVWIADTPEGFAEGIVELLRNRERWERMQAAGQAFIRENYAPDAVARESEQFVRSLLDKRFH